MNLMHRLKALLVQLSRALQSECMGWQQCQPVLLFGDWDMKTYECLVKAQGWFVTVRVQAQGVVQAKWQLEAMYGAANVVQIPREV